jgi:hypothetical protein
MYCRASLQICKHITFRDLYIQKYSAVWYTNTANIFHGLIIYSQYYELWITRTVLEDFSRPPHYSLAPRVLKEEGEATDFWPDS